MGFLTIISSNVCAEPNNSENTFTDLVTKSSESLALTCLWEHSRGNTMRVEITQDWHPVNVGLNLPSSFDSCDLA